MEWTVAVGVDTHRDEHVAVALDRVGRRLGSLAIRVDECGFGELIEFARKLGEPAFAVEGTGCYGASLARALLTAGFAVFECGRPERRHRGDKNDLIDAERAAERLLSGRSLPRPRTGRERAAGVVGGTAKRAARAAPGAKPDQGGRDHARAAPACGAQ